jgi:sodium/bile acid cotransporter 7
VLPLMLFHQMQLMVCAVIAKRRAHDPVEEAAGVTSSASAEPSRTAVGTGSRPR